MPPATGGEAFTLLVNFMTNHHEEIQAKLRERMEGSSKHIVQPFPTLSMKYPRWPIPAFFLSPLVALGLNYEFHTYWFWTIPGCVMVILICQQRLFVRCPQCSRRLHVRTVRQKIGAYQQEDHMYYDCPDCKITWDPHITGPAPSHYEP